MTAKKILALGVSDTYVIHNVSNSNLHYIRGNFQTDVSIH